MTKIALKTSIEEFPRELIDLLFREEGFSFLINVNKLVKCLENKSEKLEEELRKEMKIYELYEELCKDIGIEPEKIEETPQEDVRLKSALERLTPQNDKIIKSITFNGILRLRYLKNLLEDLNKIKEILLKVEEQFKEILNKAKYKDIELRLNLVREDPKTISFRVSIHVVKDSNYFL